MMFRLLVIAGCVWIAAPQLQAAEPLSSVMAMEEAAADISVGGVSVAQTGTDGNGLPTGGEAEKNDPELEALQKQMHESCENRLTQLGSSETEKRRFGEERKKWQEAVAAVFKSGLSAAVANDIAKEAYRNNRWCSNEISGISNRVYLATLDQLKDDPKKVLKSMQALVDKNNLAAAEYLILSTIYQPEKTDSEEFEKIAERLHSAIMKRYEELVPAQPAYAEKQKRYLGRVRNGYLNCFKNTDCLVEVAAHEFGDIRVPCKTAQRLNLAAILDEAEDGGGSRVFDLSNCRDFPEYKFPEDVEKYKKYIDRKLGYAGRGAFGSLSAARDRYKDILSRYTPDWNFEYLDYPQENRGARPLEDWAMESYSNYAAFTEILGYGIGFQQAEEMLKAHYEEVFKADPYKARLYANFVLTPSAAGSRLVNKNTLRYKILSGTPAEEIKNMLEQGKLAGQPFDEPVTPHPADSILMISVHRPDILKLLLEICPKEEGKLQCAGLDTDVNSRNAFGKTALMYAAQHGFTDSLKLLVEAGADVNMRTNPPTFDEGGKCADDVCMMNGGRTALMYAAQEGQAEAARYLVEKGADPTAEDSRGMTAYDYLTGKAPHLGVFNASPASKVVLEGNREKAQKAKPRFSDEVIAEFRTILLSGK